MLEFILNLKSIAVVLSQSHTDTLRAGNKLCCLSPRFPVEGEQGGSLPSCFCSHAVKCPRESIQRCAAHISERGAGEFPG